MSHPPHHPITREALASGAIQQMVQERDGGEHDMLDDAALLASRRSMVADNVSEDVWLFGYGSLIWNPVVEVKETRHGRIYGYRRRFCLRTMIGRGTPEAPGLVLGLDHGGSCTGLGIRIDAAIAPQELDLVWKREMLNESYHPAWVNIHTDSGIIRGLTFVMNRKHRSYAPDLSVDEKVSMIANAHGFIGPCRDYLTETLASLDELGIRDRYLEDIARRIDQLPAG
ncbi:MAG: gamma-glutamylcyclotransferase [Candidatus Puniceispirillales bacterium]